MPNDPMTQFIIVRPRLLLHPIDITGIEEITHHPIPGVWLMLAGDDLFFTIPNPDHPHHPAAHGYFVAYSCRTVPRLTDHHLVVIVQPSPRYCIIVDLVVTTHPICCYCIRAPELPTTYHHCYCWIPRTFQLLCWNPLPSTAGWRSQTPFIIGGFLVLTWYLLRIWLVIDGYLLDGDGCCYCWVYLVCEHWLVICGGRLPNVRTSLTHWWWTCQALPSHLTFPGRPALIGIVVVTQRGDDLLTVVDAGDQYPGGWIVPGYCWPWQTPAGPVNAPRHLAQPHPTHAFATHIYTLRSHLLIVQFPLPALFPPHTTPRFRRCVWFYPILLFIAVGLCLLLPHCYCCCCWLLFQSPLPHCSILNLPRPVDFTQLLLLIVAGDTHRPSLLLCCCCFTPPFPSLVADLLLNGPVVIWLTYTPLVVVVVVGLPTGWLVEEELHYLHLIIPVDVLLGRSFPTLRRLFCCCCWYYCDICYYLLCGIAWPCITDCCW